MVGVEARVDGLLVPHGVDVVVQIRERHAPTFPGTL
jgi:hypothetical protein